MELDNPLESFLLHLEAKKQQKNMKVITIVNNGHATCQKHNPKKFLKTAI